MSGLLSLKILSLSIAIVSESLQVFMIDAVFLNILLLFLTCESPFYILRLCICFSLIDFRKFLFFLYFIEKYWFLVKILCDFLSWKVSQRLTG